MLFPAVRRPSNTVPKLIGDMCKKASASSQLGDKDKYVGVSASGLKLRRSAALLSPSIYSLYQPPFTKKKITLLVMVTLFLVSTILFTSLYTFHRGFRRTIQFWKGMAPFVIEYKLLKFKAKKIDKVSEEEFERRLGAFREKTAPQVVDLIISLGGIYVKIGQVMSTIGQGILPEQYIKALIPLQNGVPARDYEQVSKIIEKATGKKMDEIFLSFDEKPIGAASIAQAHRATLRPIKEGDKPEQVIVKIQYPEVADLFEADLANLELATRLVAPENIEMAKALRKRHQNELDFTVEAENLRECTRDMQKHGLEPSLVRIPRVKNETGICSENVLVMEYLEGTPLSDAIQYEQDKVARALGKQDANELKEVLSKRMREHFDKGGGAGEGGTESMLGGKGAKMVSVFGPAASSVLRAYASVRDGVENAAIQFGSKIRAGLSSNKVGIIEDTEPISNKRHNVNLGRALKTLVYVHGIQLMLGSAYNADPHPGNVLVLPDGRLGLLDYGMVGRLPSEDKETVAKAILALSNRDKKSTAQVYRESGYRATVQDGEEADDNTLHRFASFHLDRIDLSPLTLDNGETKEMMEVLRGTRERVVPLWIEEGRRLGGLMQGVSAQAARPISLAKEWAPIAKQVLRNK